jgi:hypothetical protein
MPVIIRIMASESIPKGLRDISFLIIKIQI